MRKRQTILNNQAQVIDAGGLNMLLKQLFASNEGAFCPPSGIDSWN